MTVAIIAVVAVLLVAGVGLLVFSLMRRSQTAVPRAADEPAAYRDQVVGLDERGAPITESQEAPTASRDGAAFEGVLRDEIRDLGREQPADDRR